MGKEEAKADEKWFLKTGLGLKLVRKSQGRGGGTPRELAGGAPQEASLCV